MVSWKRNDVSDALSRDNDRTGEELAHILSTFVPEQVPQFQDCSTSQRNRLTSREAAVTRATHKDQSGVETMGALCQINRNHR